MALTNVWIASFFGPPPAAIGATPVWIAPNDGTVPSAVQSVIAGYFTPVAGASPVWIAGFFAPPPAAIGATPICISGWGGGVLVIPGSPVNTVAPVASGTLTVGSTLSCTTGTWTNSPTGYAYQWLRNGVNISGATSGSYVVVAADAGTSVRCTVTASNAIGSTSATSNALSIAALPSAPSNTVVPVVSGTATVGSTLSCTTGTWTNSPTSYAYQWQRNGVDTSGAISATYLLVAADGGTSVSCRVTATNAVGNTSIASNALAILGIPANTAAPVASGTLTVGSTLSCTTGTWTNSPTYAYQWQRGGANISGATSSTYVTVSADGGTSVGCLVTATNASGSASQASNTLAIAAGGHSPQALAYLARTVGGNEGGNATNIATLIDGLVSDGVWAKLDALYVLAQQNATDALLNLVGTSYPVTNSGALPFTAYQGFQGSSSIGNEYMDTLFNPTTALSPNFTLNNASIGVWVFNSRTTAGTNSAAMGNNSGSGSAIVWPLGASNKLTGTVNDVAYTSSTATMANAQGLTVVDRAASNSFAFYKNGALFETEAVPSAAMTSADIFLFSINNVGSPIQPTDDLLSAAFIGGSLGAAGQLALYNRLKTYMDAVAPAHSSQALAYLARTVGGNEGGNGANIATLIDGLVSDGVWAKLDALYVMAQQNQTDALLNLVGTSYGLTSVGLLRSAIFTSYLGFSGFSGAVYLNTGFNPATATSPQFIQNAASLGAWVSGTSGEVQPVIGNDGGGIDGLSHIYTNVSGSLYTRVNGVVGGVPSTGAAGLYVGDRPSSATVVPYYNGAAQAAQAGTSNPPLNAIILIGTTPNVSGATFQTISAAFIGASLGASMQLALYNRLRTYMAAIGVP